MAANDRQVGGTHYKDKLIQPWDAMEVWFTKEQFNGFLLGNVIKYVARYSDKGGVQDLEKAKHYLEKCLENIHDRKGEIDTLMTEQIRQHFKDIYEANQGVL